jgi:uncharacterized lipoprotein YddW (UPF0748 family)
MIRSIAAVALAASLLAAPSSHAQEPGSDRGAPAPAQLAAIATSGSITGRGFPMVESRGVWLTRTELCETTDALLARLDALKRAGFNTVYPLTSARGSVMYPGSKFLPQWKEITTTHSDILAWLVPAIHARGMRVEAWPEYGFYAYWTPDRSSTSRGYLLDRHPELTAIDKNGLPYHDDPKLGWFYGICPANPASHDFLAGMILEQLDRYPFDGVNLDRIRFTNDKFCHCDYCKAHFREMSGFELKPDFAPGSSEAKAWDGYRRAATREFVRKLRAAMRERHPGKSITAAVVAPEMIREKGQDWYSWVREGLVDAVCPMLYRANLAPDIATIQAEIGVDAPVFYGIASDMGRERFASQVQQLRSLAAPGFTVWYAGTLDKLMPQVGPELFFRRAVSPLDPRVGEYLQPRASPHARQLSPME